MDTDEMDIFKSEAVYLQGFFQCAATLALEVLLPSKFSVPQNYNVPQHRNNGASWTTEELDCDVVFGQMLM